MIKRISAILVFLLTSGILNSAVWIEPDWEGNPPKDQPHHLYYEMTPIKKYPVIYRIVLSIDKSVSYAVVRVKAKKRWFGYVNGKLIDNSRESLEEKYFMADLSPYLVAGKNVFACSTSTYGFILGGYIVYGDDSLDKIETTGKWKVQQFPATVILEKEPFMKSDFDDSKWYKVKEVKSKKTEKVSLYELTNKYVVEETKRLYKKLETAVWKYEILSKKGVVVVDWEAFAFGGRGRIPLWVTSFVDRKLEEKEHLQKTIDEIQAESAKINDLDADNGKDFKSVKGKVDEYRTCADALSCWVRVNDEKDNLENHESHFSSIGNSAGTKLKEEIKEIEKILKKTRSMIKKDDVNDALKKLEKTYAEIGRIKKLTEDIWGHKLNVYNETMYNPFGWFDNTDLMDSNLNEWGLRVNPVEVSWVFNLDGKWRFKTDPDNVGLKESRHTLDYNIENQWRELTVPGSWEKQNVLQENPNTPGDTPYPGINVRKDGPYNGYAWYRKTLKIPSEWAGCDLELYIERIDDWDWAYFNGEEIGHTGADTERWWRVSRTYKIPSKIVNFGGYNAIAIRIYDCGDWGALDSVEIRCPSLKESYEKRPKKKYIPTEIYSSPLSPAILLTTGEDKLNIWGWEQRRHPGPKSLIIPTKENILVRSIKDGEIYNSKKDKPLSANWVLIWSDIENENSELPMLLVMEKSPYSIHVTKGPFGVGNIELKFKHSKVDVLMIHPFNEKQSVVDKVSADIIKKCSFWSSALLAYPVGYTEILKRNKDDKWQLDVVDIYDYRIMRDEFKTEPTYLALLPPLACFGHHKKYPKMEITDDIKETGLNMGEWGELRGKINAKSISYKIPISQIKRDIGFSHYCYGDTDTGVPGNLREIEIIKNGGANSWRPQHNRANEQAKKTAEWCVEYGINNTFNTSTEFAVATDMVKHYRTLAKMCKDFPEGSISYDLVNEPHNMAPDVYNPLMKKITREIRKFDKKSIIYVETPYSWASVTRFKDLELTGDPKTAYSFHEYAFRLPPYWPSLDTDISILLKTWMPAFKFMIEKHTILHVGEYGAHEQTQNDPFNNLCAITVTLDMLKVMDQFNIASHYYSNRESNVLRTDGSISQSLVWEGYRRYFEKGTAHYYFE